MKYLIIASALLLVGCNKPLKEPETNMQIDGFRVACIDNVQYWIRNADMRAGLMSVRIDPKTLKPRNCK